MFAAKHDDATIVQGLFTHGRLPSLLQAEAAECGVVCVAMIAQYYRPSVTLAEIRRSFNVSLRGTTLGDLIAIAGNAGLSTRALRCELSALSRIRLPAILHWDMNHYVVLREIRRGRLIVHDPASGRRSIARGEAAKHFTGVALELTPIADLHPKPAAPRFRLRSMFTSISGLGRGVAHILILALALEIVGLIAPFIMQWVIDGVLVSGDRELLLAMAAGYALLILLYTALNGLRSWAVLYLSTQINVQWLAATFSHLIRLPIGFFEKRHLGDVISRFDSVRQIQQILSTTFFEAGLDGLMGLAALSVMVLYNAKLSLIAFSAVVIYVLVRQAFYGALRSANAESLMKWAIQASCVLETMRGVQSLRLYGMESQRRALWLSYLVDAVNRDVAKGKLTIGYTTAGVAIFGIERVATLALGAVLVLNHVFTLGMLVAFLAYKELFIMRVPSLIDNLFSLRLLEVYRDRLADIVQTQPETLRPALAPAPAASVTIEVQGIAFRYADTAPCVLDDVSLTIEPGKMTAITGPSGCGKTTLVKIILGLLEPERGRVLVNGVEIRQAGLAEFRASVGSVMQEDMLFAGTIGENISLFDPAPDRDRVVEAAKTASIHDDISRMPMRYDTLVGDMGSAFSGGQRQRILLARAIYRRPSVLILDEATSQLDVMNERRINDAMSRLSMTRVVIAHRTETIACADRVIVMRDGKVVG